MVTSLVTSSDPGDDMYLLKSFVRDHELTQDEIDFIKRLTESKFSSKHDDTPEWTDLYSHEVELHPINRAPESKKSFVPSYDERAKVKINKMWI